MSTKKIFFMVLLALFLFTGCDVLVLEENSVIQANSIPPDGPLIIRGIDFSHTNVRMDMAQKKLIEDSVYRFHFRQYYTNLDYLLLRYFYLDIVPILKEKQTVSFGSAGTATIIKVDDKSMILLTAAHIIKEPYIKMKDGHICYKIPNRYKITLWTNENRILQIDNGVIDVLYVGNITDSDLALIRIPRIPGINVLPTNIATTEYLETTDFIYVFAAPGLAMITVQDGSVVNKGNIYSDEYFYKIYNMKNIFFVSNGINKGSSGGVAFALDSAGTFYLVGLVHSIYPSSVLDSDSKSLTSVYAITKTDPLQGILREIP